MRPSALSVVLFVVLALCPVADAADYGTYSVQEYPLPANATDIGAMTVDANGNVWLIQDEPPVLYKLARANGTFSNYTLKGFEKAGFAGMSVDEEGIVWFADQEGNRFGAYTEQDNHTATFSFPGPMAPSSVLRRGDAVWLGCKEEVGEYDLRTREFLDHFVYHMDSYLRDIHFDRLSNVWAVQYAKNNVSVYWRTYGRTSEFGIPTADSYPTCLAIDNRSRLWFVESGPDKLGMFDTEVFSFAEYDAPVIDGKRAVLSRVAAANGSVWLTDVRNGRLLVFHPDERRFAAAELGEGALPSLIEADAGGSLWVYEAGRKALAKVQIRESFGEATPTPEPTVTPHPASPTPAPLPTKTPGFAALVPLLAGLIATALRAASRP
jgi:streptogramin lyase